MVHLWSLAPLLYASLVWALPKLASTPTRAVPGGPTLTTIDPSLITTVSVAVGTPAFGGATTLLPLSYLTALPIDVSFGGDPPVVYADNSSLLQAKPNIQSEVNKNISLIEHTLRNLTTRDVQRRDECTKGMFTQPQTSWGNIEVLIPSVCNSWFPGGTVWIPGSSYGKAVVYLGPSYPHIEFEYQTIPMCSTCAVWMTPAVCESTLYGLIAWSGANNWLGCPFAPNINEVDNFDKKNLCINFRITVF